MRSVTPHGTRVTRAARHSFARARHHRASRASSPVPFPPLARARALRRRRRSLARLLALMHTRSWRAVAVAVAATDDARGDGRGGGLPSAPPSGTGACQLRPPRRSTTASPPSSSRLCPLSRPRSHDARAGETRHPHHPPVRPDDGAFCARGSRRPPPPRARASETETAQRRHSDTTTRRRQLGVAGRSRSAVRHRTAEPEPE